MNIKITNIYDNNSCNNQLKSDWGFSCVIEHPNGKIIFDSGAKSEILEENLQKLSINPSEIDRMIISHKHWDHCGGALWLLEKNREMTVFLPKTLTKSLENKLSSKAKEIHSIKKNFVIDNTFQLIVLRKIFLVELVLTIKTPKGIIAVTGCSHSGIDKIVDTVKDVTGENIWLLFGGFHLHRSSKSKISDIAAYLKNQQIAFVAPCHCTGQNALKIFRDEFKENFLTNGVGTEYTLKI